MNKIIIIFCFVFMCHGVVQADGRVSCAVNHPHGAGCSFAIDIDGLGEDVTGAAVELKIIDPLEELQNEVKALKDRLDWLMETIIWRQADGTEHSLSEIIKERKE